jgi:hypothetical protein
MPMAITLLYGCCQIETSARSLDETRRFFHEALGAFPIEQELAKQIDAIAPGTSYGCDHLGLGEAVFQINQPDPAMVFNGHPSIHQAYLDSQGPCVTNLNFFIDDWRHAKDLLMGLGAPLHIEGPSSAAPALADYGPGNTRPGADERPFLFLGARALIGFDLELMEPNFLRFSEQTVQHPAFVHPRPAGDDGLLLHCFRVAVADLEATLANLEHIFAPGCRSKAYAWREGPLGRACRICLGGIEIEYCQPAGTGGRLARLLDSYGPGVVAIDFLARDLAAARARAGGLVEAREEPDWLGTGARTGAIYLASREPIGFDVVLLPPSLDRRTG